VRGATERQSRTSPRFICTNSVRPSSVPTGHLLPMGEGKLAPLRCFATLFKGINGVFVLEQETQLVDACQQTLPSKPIDLKSKPPTIRQFDLATRQVNRQFNARMIQQITMLTFRQHHREQAVLQGIAAKNVGDLARQHRAKSRIEQGPGRVLTRRTATKISPRHENLRTARARLVQHEFRIRRAISAIAPIVKREAPEAGALGGGEKSRRDDAVRIDVFVRQHHGARSQRSKRLHGRFLYSVAA